MAATIIPFGPRNNNRDPAMRARAIEIHNHETKYLLFCLESSWLYQRLNKKKMREAEHRLALALGFLNGNPFYVALFCAAYRNEVAGDGDYTGR